MFDDGKERILVRLDTPTKGVYIKNHIWREFTNFSDNCVIMVLASDYYDENDYIFEYSKFIELVTKTKNF